MAELCPEGICYSTTSVPVTLFLPACRGTHRPLPRVAFCVRHCQFHHCLLKSVPIMVINPFRGQLYRANDLQLFVSKYNQRLYGAIKRENWGDFKEELWKKSKRRNVGKYSLFSLLHKGCVQILVRKKATKVTFAGSRNGVKTKIQRVECPVGVTLHWSEFSSHELPDSFFRRRNRSGKSSVGTLFFMNRAPSPVSRETLSTSGSSQQCRHRKAHYGVARGRQQMLLINFAHRPLKKCFSECLQMDKTKVGRN